MRLITKESLRERNAPLLCGYHLNAKNSSRAQGYANANETLMERFMQIEELLEARDRVGSERREIR